MVNPTLLLTSALLASTGAAVDFRWNRCRNVPTCKSSRAPGGPGYVNPTTVIAQGNAVAFYPGMPLFPYRNVVGFVYDRKNGYWYSKEKAGVYISPEGYVHLDKGYDRIGIHSKDGSIGSTYWRSDGANCCLPDSVGTNIYNVYAWSYSGAAAE